MPDGRDRDGPPPLRRRTPSGRLVIDVLRRPDILHPLGIDPDYTRNLFEKTRPGQVVIRPEDLLAFRVELRDMEHLPGTPPRIRATSDKARLILHFPPQSITEETFYEVTRAKPSDQGNPSPPPFTATDPSDVQDKPLENHPNATDKYDGGGAQADDDSDDDDLREPPIRARIADESRLAFVVPRDTELDYTLAGLLTAVQHLELEVAANALPGRRRRNPAGWKDLFSEAVLSDLGRLARVGYAPRVASALRLGRAHGGLQALRARQHRGEVVIGRIPDDLLVPLPALKPQPAEPGSGTTSIEMPWRLVISPHAGGRWRHTTEALTSEATGHTELWHTQLVTPASDGSEILPSYDDPNRTIRAIWARSGSGWEQMTPAVDDPAALSNGWPKSDSLPKANHVPFRMPLDNNDRFQLVHLSSNFVLSDYHPSAVDTRMLALSALGGWLDSRGAWDPPGLSIEEWQHRATMGRDHYVKVVYRGFLYPFGHRVSLVKVSERRFHPEAAARRGRGGRGNPAYLRQRYYLVIREKVRTFDDGQFAATRSKDGQVRFANQFPFASVEILLDVSPDLAKPETNAMEDGNARMAFFPYLGAAKPFRFPCAGIDLDGRRVTFDLPMIFVDNAWACPRQAVGQGNDVVLVPMMEFAHDKAAEIRAFHEASDVSLRTADLKAQSLSLAPPLKPGDTAVKASLVHFAGETSPSKDEWSGDEAERFNQTLSNYSQELTRPVFIPKIERIEAQIGVMSGLTGTKESNTLTWNARYLRFGLSKDDGTPYSKNDDANLGEVFVDVEGPGKMDFSAQGDRSGGFLQPNLAPRALSRLAGPVMADVTQFSSGVMEQGAGFGMDIQDLPLPLLFGCIELGDIIGAVEDLAGGTDKVPKFLQEGGDTLENFVSTLATLYGAMDRLASDPAGVADGLLTQGKVTAQDLVAQAGAYDPVLVQQVVARANLVESRLLAVQGVLASVRVANLDDLVSGGDLAALASALQDALDALDQLAQDANATPNNVALPAGYRQQALNLVAKQKAALESLQELAALVTAGKGLFDALAAIVDAPGGIGSVLTDENLLLQKIQDLKAALGTFKPLLATFDLFNGAARSALVNAIDALDSIADNAQSLMTLVQALAGDELTLRFDWKPEIDSFPASDPIFRANDKRGLVVAVEAKVKKTGNTTPKISVVCALRSFDLVLIAPASFIELQFDYIQFSVDAAAKMDVDVQLNEIKFVGPLSFVETLKDLIPLDGFSDPPYLDITPQGIDAGFNIALPSIAVGVLNISNLSLGAGVTVPFIGQPVSVRFNFCTREQPFCLTVWMFGGGGFFGIAIDPRGVQMLEAAFEFGAAISVDFGVASGGVEVMAGIYFRIEWVPDTNGNTTESATITGYFRLGGHVDVLGLITASLELYLELSYESSSGKCTGKAELTIEVEVFVFSGSVTVRAERKFAGANGDPSLRVMLGHLPELSLQDELDQIDSDAVEYPWREYAEAFA